MAEKILITGVAGFIGSNLARRLIDKGHAVVGLDADRPDITERIPQSVEFHPADIRSVDIRPFFKDVDVVFHLAAKNSLGDCQKDPVGTMDINVVGTAQVFDAALRAGVRKVAYAQSSVLEEGEARLKGFYAISKAAGAMLADGYHDLGLTTIGLRYFNVYGPGQDYRRSAPPIMSDLIIRLLTGKPVTLYEGSELNKRDFIHVDDINVFHEFCITDTRADNQMVRLGSGTNHSMLEVYDAIQKILGTSVTPTFLPRANDDPPVETLADISFARSLGWEPHVSLEEGLRSMVDYIKKEIAAGNIK